MPQGTLETDLRTIHNWHRVADVAPILAVMLEKIEDRIDTEMLERDPMDPSYPTAATAAWMERRAVQRIRKELNRLTKSGKTASHRVQNKL